jgi:hypothetical protein
VLRDAVEAVRREHPTADVELLVVEGPAAHVLVEMSADADMLVLGSRGLGGFRGLLLGSVSLQSQPGDLIKYSCTATRCGQSARAVAGPRPARRPTPTFVDAVEEYLAQRGVSVIPVYRSGRRQLHRPERGLAVVADPGGRPGVHVAGRHVAS